MKLIPIGAMIACLATIPAAAQAQKGEPGIVKMGRDADTGELVATARGWSTVKETHGYSVATQQRIAIRVEAVKAIDGAKRIRLVGEKARLLFPREAHGSQTYGPSDPPDPVYVGSPFKEADLRYRGAEVLCSDDAHFCEQLWHLEILVPAETLEAFLRNPKAKELEVALDKRRKVDWRVSRAEIEAALNALDHPSPDPDQ
jgi:hypothetical protein